MKKYTRRHYNKKLLALGLSAFMGIGLISTGFAAWVMSKDEQVESNGNVNVAIMKDSSINIKLWALNSDGSIKKDGDNNVELGKDTDNKYILTDTFNFDADINDKTGRLRYEGDATGGEDLIVTIKGSIEETGIPYALKAELVLPESIQNAINQGYLKLSPATEELLKPNTRIDVEADGSFTVVIELAWGDKFQGDNPSIYYDEVYPESTTENPLGQDIDNTTMQEEMTAFWYCLTGEDATSNNHMSQEYSFNGQFTIKLIATALDTDTNS